MKGSRVAGGGRVLTIGILERPSRGLCVRGWEMELEGGDPRGPPQPTPAPPCPSPSGGAPEGRVLRFPACKPRAQLVSDLSSSCLPVPGSVHKPAIVGRQASRHRSQVEGAGSWVWAGARVDELCSTGGREVAEDRDGEGPHSFWGCVRPARRWGDGPLLLAVGKWSISRR